MNTNPELAELLLKAREAWDAMSPEQRQKALERQRESYVVAEMGMGSDADEQAYRAALANGDTSEIERLDAAAAERMRLAREMLGKRP